MIERLLVINNPEEQERLWDFYEKIFQPVNELTPIIQTFSKDSFIKFLVSTGVVKFIAREDSEIVGLGFISSQIELDKWLSPAYFAKHYPSKVVYHVPIIAIAPNRRRSCLSIRIVKAMINEVPDDAVVAFTHSELVNPLMPKLIEATRVTDYCVGGKVDAEACLVFKWKDKKVLL